MKLHCNGVMCSFSPVVKKKSKLVFSARVPCFVDMCKYHTLDIVSKKKDNYLFSAGLPRSVSVPLLSFDLSHSLLCCVPIPRKKRQILSLSLATKVRIRKRCISAFMFCDFHNLQLRFITFTSLPDDNKKIHKAFINCMENLRKQLPDLKYLWVAEYQLNGTVHFHTFFITLSNPDYKVIGKAWKSARKNMGVNYLTDNNKVAWGFKSVFLSAKNKLNNYITKYVTKNTTLLEKNLIVPLFNCCRWFSNIPTYIDINIDFLKKNLFRFTEKSKQLPFFTMYYYVINDSLENTIWLQNCLKSLIKSYVCPSRRVPHVPLKDSNYLYNGLPFHPLISQVFDNGVLRKINHFDSQLLKIILQDNFVFSEFFYLICDS